MTHDPLSQWTSVARQALATDLGVEIPEADAQFLLGYAVAKAGDDKLNEAAHALMRLSGEWDLGLHRE